MLGARTVGISHTTLQPMASPTFPRLLLLLLLLAMVAFAAVPTAASAAELTCSFFNNVIIGEDSIDLQSASSAADCCNKCNANDMCIAFTFDTDSKDCYLKVLSSIF